MASRRPSFAPPNISEQKSNSSSSLKKSLSVLGGSRLSIASRATSIKNVRMSTSNLGTQQEGQGQPLPKSQQNIMIKSTVNVIKETSPSTGDYYHDRELTGIFPLFLTSQSQALVKAVIEEDITAEKMFRMIPKSDLMQDMATRLAISDFTPAKAQILAYPREEMMLHYDPEYKYTQNFFLVIDLATVDSILAPPGEEIAEDRESGLDGLRKDRVRGWKSLGSEREVEMEWIKDMEFPVHIQVSRKYGEFNAPITFSDRDAQDGFLEIKSYKDANYELAKLEVQTGIQAVPKVVDAYSQTYWNRAVNFSCQYEAIEMNEAEKMEIQQSEALETFFLNISEKFEEYLQLNEIMDIFQNDYALLGEEELALEQGSHAVLQEYQSFTDLQNSKDKCISCIDWHPTLKGVLAISCTQSYGFDDRIIHGFTVKAKKSMIIIWSFHDPIHPQLILESPEDVCTFQIHPVDQNIIVAGCVNGQIVLWDISEYQDRLQSSRKRENEIDESATQGVHTPIVRFSIVSSIESSHRAPVTDIHWLPKHFEMSNNGEVLENGENGDKQIVTGSLDGTIAFWDLRFKKDWKSLDLAWRPFLRIPITAMDNSFDYSVTRVSLKTIFHEEAATGKSKALGAPPEGANDASKKIASKLWTSKFYCATEEGDLVYADWTSEKVSEEKASKVEFATNAHFGSICDLERSPFFPEIFLSAGGWSFNIWKEKMTAGPLVSSVPSNSNVTSAKWSPSRPGVFYIGRADGVLEVWDLADRSHSATSFQSVATSAISSINIRQYPGKSAQQFIAVGDDSGTLHILETPRNLQKMQKNEKQLIAALFDRESRRLTSTLERKKLHLKARPVFEATQVEATVAAAKIAQLKADEDTQKTVELAADSAESIEEKAYKDMEKAVLEMLLPPAAEI